MGSRHRCQHLLRPGVWEWYGRKAQLSRTQERCWALILAQLAIQAESMVLVGWVVLGELLSGVTAATVPPALASVSSQVLVVMAALRVGLDQEIQEVIHRKDH